MNCPERLCDHDLFDNLEDIYHHLRWDHNRSSEEAQRLVSSLNASQSEMEDNPE